MEFSITRVNRDTVQLFDDMVFQRINERERSDNERKEMHDFNPIYEALDNENLYVFAAQVKDKFVGWISIVYIPKISRTNEKGHLFIDELWVNPAFRKQGIANALMEQAEALSKEKALGLRLYVDPTNEEAVSLYKKFKYDFKFGTARFMEKEWES